MGLASSVTPGSAGNSSSPPQFTPPGGVRLSGMGKAELDLPTNHCVEWAKSHSKCFLQKPARWPQEIWSPQPGLCPAPGQRTKPTGASSRGSWHRASRVEQKRHGAPGAPRTLPGVLCSSAARLPGGRGVGKAAPQPPWGREDRSQGCGDADGKDGLSACPRVAATFV